MKLINSHTHNTIRWMDFFLNIFYTPKNSVRTLMREAFFLCFFYFILQLTRLKIQQVHVRNYRGNCNLRCHLRWHYEKWLFSKFNYLLFALPSIRFKHCWCDTIFKWINIIIHITKFFNCLSLIFHSNSGCMHTYSFIMNRTFSNIEKNDLVQEYVFFEYNHPIEISIRILIETKVWIL